MTQIPGLPQLAKAALVVFDPPSPTPSLITFQYNPETMSRDLKASAVEGGARSDAFRLSGAPVETIKMEAIFDATDKLEAGDVLTQKAGVYPQLASLENLIAPKSRTVLANTALLSMGTIEILPTSAPFTVLVWGKRVLPVRIGGFAITEDAFDSNLSPVRAKVSLDFTVLTYSDLDRSHPGYAMYLGHQVIKETLGLAARTGNAASVLSQKISAS